MKKRKPNSGPTSFLESLPRNLGLKKLRGAARRRWTSPQEVAPWRLSFYSRESGPRDAAGAGCAAGRGGTKGKNWVSSPTALLLEGAIPQARADIAQKLHIVKSNDLNHLGTWG